MADDVLKIFADSRIDAKSLSGFMSEPSDVLVPRRLAPPVNTLDYFLNLFNNVADDGANAIEQAIINSGFVTIDSFELGATLTQRNQALRRTADGKLYRWAGDLPKVVPASSTPTNTGGVGDNAWLEVSDQTLRNDIANNGFITDTVVKTTALAGAIGAVERDQESINAEHVSVKTFGAMGDGSDATQAFIDAINFGNLTGSNIAIPKGKFLITGELPMPNRCILSGGGYGSNLELNLPDNTFCFNGDGVWLYRFGMQNIRFSVKTGASNKVGSIRLNQAQRGNFIHNIWHDQLDYNFYIKGSIWGILSIRNIFSNRLGVGLNPKLQGNVAIDVSGNTIMMQDIEVIGAFHTGLKWSGRVGYLKGFNIGGSQDIFMYKGVDATGLACATISDGWLERFDEYEWGNGEAPAIYVKDSSAVSVNAVNISTGSLYIDNSVADLKGVTYSQANAGLRTRNGAVVTTDLLSIKKMGVLSSGVNTDGQVYISDLRKATAGLISNNLLITALPHTVTKTNAGIVTLSSETADYLSGDRSLSIEAPKYQGVFITKTGLKPDTLYTVMVLVKNVSNVLISRLSPEAAMGRVISDYPQSLGNTRAEWTRMAVVMQTGITSTEVKVKLYAEPVDDTINSKFLIDSVDIVEGYSEIMPNNILNYAPPISGTTAQRPSYKNSVGQSYYDTTLSKPVFYNGTEWVDSTGVVA